MIRLVVLAIVAGLALATCSVMRGEHRGALRDQGIPAPAVRSASPPTWGEER